MNADLDLTPDDDARIDSLLRGASARLVEALDPAAPAEPSAAAAAVPDHAVPSPVSPGRGAVVPINVRPQRRWGVFLAGAAAAMVGLVTVGAISRVDSRDASSQASATTVLDEWAAAAPEETVAAPVDTMAAAATETTAAAATETTAAAATETIPAVSETAAAGEEEGAAAPSAEAPADLSAPPAKSKSADARRAQSTMPFTPSELPVIVDPRVAPSTQTSADNQSTFALDVDTGSYTRLRDMLRSNGISSIDPAAVRTEELINAFEQDYAPPSNGTFAIRVDGARVPFLPPSTRLVRVGIKAKEIARSERTPANLTFVLDASQSMDEEGKLDLAKDSLRILLGQLGPDDRVAIVAFSDDAWTVLDSTPVSRRSSIEAAIASITTVGSTNAEAGLRRGYAIAREMRDNDRINRVILASDGVANVGPTGPDEILRTIKEEAGKGIQLITVGVGLSTFNDPMMEQLADGGDGFYTFIDSRDQARQVFEVDLVQSLETVALDAKVQVTFDQDKVVAYRLMGYENRAVADSQFRNDRVDAGEIGAGHEATALYMVELAPGASGKLAEVELRWTESAKGRGRGDVQEIDEDIRLQAIDRELIDAAPRLQQDVYVAALAEILRGGPWSTRIDARDAAARTGRLVALLPGDPRVAELAELISLAAGQVPQPPVEQPPTTRPW
jgi:Ca-activated chloride channel homolog